MQAAAGVDDHGGMLLQGVVVEDVVVGCGDETVVVGHGFGGQGDGFKVEMVIPFLLTVLFQNALWEYLMPAMLLVDLFLWVSRVPLL